MYKRSHYPWFWLRSYAIVAQRHVCIAFQPNQPITRSRTIIYIQPLCTDDYFENASRTHNVKDSCYSCTKTQLGLHFVSYAFLLYSDKHSQVISIRVNVCLYHAPMHANVVYLGRTFMQLLWLSYVKSMMYFVYRKTITQLYSYITYKFYSIHYLNDTIRFHVSIDIQHQVFKCLHHEKHSCHILLAYNYFKKHP